VGGLACLSHVPLDISIALAVCLVHPLYERGMDIASLVRGRNKLGPYGMLFTERMHHLYHLLFVSVNNGCAAGGEVAHILTCGFAFWR